MKYIKQFGIILIISFIGEFLNKVIPLPVPASIYGIVILFLSLKLKIIKLEAIKETGIFLIEIMPIMFIPAAVGILESWPVLASSWLSYMIITAVSTIAVMVVSGIVTQSIVKFGKKKAGRVNGRFF